MPSSSEASQHEALLQELIALSPIEYDCRRKEEAKNLGIRVATLDAQVAARRAHLSKASDEAGTPVLFPTPEPWPTPVDGVTLLNDLATCFSRYIVLPAGGEDALALWVMHTHTFDATRVSPILALTSPQKRCGKTTVLALLKTLVRRSLPASNITPAAVFRSVDAWQPCLLVDEADSFLKHNDELRGILNSGHTRDTAYVVRTVGEDHEPRKFSTWAPKAIALIGKLPSTLEDRSIMLPMKRKRQDEHVERLKAGDLEGCIDMQRRCLRWTQDHLATLKAIDPALPSSLHDRAADNWRPLAAIADVAGGDWPARVRHAIHALEMHTHKNEDDLGVMLLEDLRHIFKTWPHTNIFSETLTSELWGLGALRPWWECQKGHPITQSGVAALLAPFDIHPGTVRVGAETKKGYRLAAFADAFARYLPPETVTPSQPSNDADFQAPDAVTCSETTAVTASQSSNGEGLDDPASVTPSHDAAVTGSYACNPATAARCDGVTDIPLGDVTDETPSSSLPHNACDGVTDQQGGIGLDIDTFDVPVPWSTILPIP